MIISIALATYNGEKFLRKQLDSILNQTLQNFEIIICDDHSEDDTWNIIQEYAKKDSRFHCFKNEKNLGFVKNFEQAILLCNGDYIALSDQDDIWIENHLEILLNHIQDNDLCLGNALFIDSYDNSLGRTHIESLGGNIEIIDTIEKKLIRVLFQGNFCQGASMLLRKDFLIRVLPVPNCVKVHDVWFALTALIEKKFVFVPDIVTLYRQHDSNVIKRPSNRSNILQKIQNVLKKRDSLKLEQIKLASEIINVQNDVKIIINQAISFHSNNYKFFYRISHLKMWIEYYPYMFMTKKHIISKTVKYIFLGI